MHVFEGEGLEKRSCLVVDVVTDMLGVVCASATHTGGGWPSMLQ